MNTEVYKISIEQLQRCRFLIIAVSSLGAVGVAGLSVPFTSSMNPSACPNKPGGFLPISFCLIRSLR